MKLLRVSEKGSEIVAALDKDQKIRDLSSKIKDLNPETLNFKVFSFKVFGSKSLIYPDKSLSFLLLSNATTISLLGSPVLNNFIN